MLVHLKPNVVAARRPRGEKPLPDYPLHASSFFTSVVVHAAVISALVSVPLGSGPAPQKSSRPVYDELIKPHEHEILYYDFRIKTPDVSPGKQIGKAPEPRGAELSREAIIATSKRPKSTQVFISVPVPKVEVHQDLPTPLLVAQMNTVLPPPPERAQPKKFVPPPPSKQEPKLALPTPVVDAQAPAIEASSMTAPVQPSTVMVALAGPPPKAPEANTAKPGTATADVAAASLHPTDDPNVRVPNADRPAQFSKAPTEGAVASGSNATASLTVPNLTVRQPKPEASLPTPAKQIFYAERVRNAQQTMSVALRPSNRMIPPFVGESLRGRDVYTIVVPIENLPTYTGDWIIWFADADKSPSGASLVRAPLPFRKLEPITFEPPLSARTGERIRVGAVLSQNGKLNAMTFLSQHAANVERAVLQDLGAWEFQPANRNGKPIDVDVVLEIPYNLPVVLAQAALP